MNNDEERRENKGSISIKQYIFMYFAIIVDVKECMVTRQHDDSMSA